ncbi:MAG: leucyl aminopeptidase [Legionellales bacterium]|nr:leucyl aminopeptidase [Legionellales bacterium]|tara:strand:+ start:17593 stop:19077 length:1485 start_codon:yes stop_codon:yes gene_type:complete
MKFTIKELDLTQQKTDCLMLAAFEKQKLAPHTAHIDKVSKKHLSDILKDGDFSGKPGETLILHKVPGIAATRVLLVGFGKEKDLTPKAYKKALENALKHIHNTKAKDAVCCLQDVIIKDKDLAWKVRQAAIVAGNAYYRCDVLKTEKDTVDMQTLCFAVNGKSDQKAAKAAAKEGHAIASGMNYSKNLGDLPGNICTPTYFAKQARELAKKHAKLSTKVLSEAEMIKLGMGAFMAVAQGSQEPAKMIIMEYKGSKKASDKPTVLVGKGITFDSGGISIKPSSGMEEMKYDMMGAATVFGVIVAAVEMQLPINLVGIIASAENMPGGKATRPGDIVTSLSGQTVEILNTDAEGRLVLCDALTYSERYKPKAIIDIATLTGAMVVGLGSYNTGLLGNDDKLIKALVAAGEETLDTAWHMPMSEEYDAELDSKFADMANIGSRWGGGITAACYLGRFMKKQKWAHLDVAGTAWRIGNEKGASGRPIPLLVEYILKHG